MDEIDRILSSEPHFEPAADFTRRVMAAVEREASVPPPLVFPWRRVLSAAAVLALSSAGVAAMPALHEPTQRVLDSLGTLDARLAAVALAALALLLGTLWAAWRAE